MEVEAFVRSAFLGIMLVCPLARIEEVEEKRIEDAPKLELCRLYRT